MSVESHASSYNTPFAPQNIAEIFQQKEIEYLVVNEFDDEDFLNYPLRAGWPAALPQHGQPPFLSPTRNGSTTVNLQSLEGFIQAWLIFGLLHELLGDLYYRSRYVKTGGEASIIHCEHLKDDLEKWSTQVKSQSHEQCITIYKHLRACLNLAHDTLIAVKIRGPSNFDRNTRQFIALLCESVVHALDLTLPDAISASGIDETPLIWKDAYIDERVLDDMVGSGVCIHRANVGLSKLLNPSSVCLIERIMIPSFNQIAIHQDHSACTLAQCCRLNISDTSYQPSHVMKDCKCSGIMIDVAELGTILDAGHLPVLQIVGDSVSQMRVSVESSARYPDFVALSHVWADGLGNKQGCELPRCQILRLKNLVGNLRGRMPWKSDQPDDRNLLLWCDTLCVPVANTMNIEEKRVRTQAMNKMRTVYQQAAYVLVLDSTLEPLSTRDVSLTEAGLRIMCSPWASRLWTWQEAVLAESLLFQFSNTAVDLREIWKCQQETRRCNFALNGICLEIIRWCVQIRLPFHVEDRSYTLGVHELTMALTGRTVSHASDEPICITTILDLDMTRMQEVSENKRMEELWKMMPQSAGGIPAMIVLDRYPRMDVQGFRWAPSTLMVTSESEMGAGALTSRGERKGRPTPSGLLVEFPAYRIRRAYPPTDVLEEEASTPINTSSRLILRANNGSWYGLYLRPVNDVPPIDEIVRLIVSEAEPTVLVLQPALASTRWNRYGMHFGLLAKQTNVPGRYEEDGVALLRSLSLVEVSMLPSHEHVVFDKGYLIAHEVARIRETRRQAQFPTSNNELAVTTQEPAQPTSSSPSLFKDLYILAKEACQSGEVRDRLLATGSSDPEGYLAFVGLQLFMARYLVIEEEFDEDTTWCID